MSTDNTPYMKRIVGYSDEISVRPGGKISFMVSSEDDTEYNASLLLLFIQYPWNETLHKNDSGLALAGKTGRTIGSFLIGDCSLWGMWRCKRSTFLYLCGLSS